MLNRREFIRSGSAAFVAGWMLKKGIVAGTTLPAVGVQLFSLPKLMEQDVAGTLKMLAKIGFKEIEFYGPFDFSAAGDKDRWKAVTPSLGFSGSGFYGHPVKDIRKMLDDNGLSAPSIHTGLFTLKENMGRMAEELQSLGTKYVILPSAPTQTSLDDYRKQAEEFNGYGSSAARYGLTFAYHNHGNGLKPMEGKIPMELILENTDPAKVKMQMDIYWTTAAGVDAQQWLVKHKGRYISMHVKDMVKKVQFSGDGGDSTQWIELFPFMTDAGSGVLDLPAIISTAKQNGVDHFIVERDLAPEPQEALSKGFKYLSTLELSK